MKKYYYVGLDLHKKSVTYCMKQADGTIVRQGTLRAVRSALAAWVEELPRSCEVGMEATMFTGWVYDLLLEWNKKARVGHPLMLRAIAASKKKNDRLDARKLADLLRCDLFPECYMAPQDLRDLRRILRYRSLLVRESTRMKNKTSGLLMECGVEYEKKKLHGRRYFNKLLERLEDVPASVPELLKFSHDSMRMFEANQCRLVRELKRHPDLKERVERLMSIRGVGEVTALTWALEIGDPWRFRSVKQAISYCGLCSAQNESAGVAKRGPISKQRNKHLQHALVEAAKLAPCWNEQLAAVYHAEYERCSNHNRATLAVARKLVAYLLYVDKSGKCFEMRCAA